MPLLCAPVPTIKSLDEAAEITGVPRRTLQLWLQQGKLTPWTIEGDRRRFVDLDEIKKLREPRPEPRPDREPLPGKPSEARAAPSGQITAKTLPQRTADERPILVAAIIPHPDGLPEVLMSGRVWAAEQVWSWVGGHVRLDEDPADAILRELGEELGLENARVVRLLGVVDTHVDTSRFWGHRFRDGYLGHNFLIAIDSPDVRVADHEELTEVAWLTLDQVAEAVAVLPGEVGEAALRFAREAVAERTLAEGERGR